jgi:hypothetical protein
MPLGHSLLSLAATGVYGCVLLMCLAAAWTASSSRQMPKHVWTWLLLALFFGVLVVVRLYEVEDAVRGSLRTAMRARGSYDQRRAIQGPIVAAIILLVGATALVLLNRIARKVRGQRNLALAAALVAAFAMLVLIALRVISLHVIDAFLYGPLKLNWVIDLGTSLIVLSAAAYYTRLVRRQR